MPQVIVFLSKEHNEIVEAYAKENELSKAETILNMIYQRYFIGIIRLLIQTQSSSWSCQQ